MKMKLAMLVACLAVHGATAQPNNKLGEAFTKDERTDASASPFNPPVFGKVNDVAYRRFGDGTANFQAQKGDWVPDGEGARPTWDVRCKTDTMDDTPSCIVDYNSIQVIAYSRACVTRVAIGSKHYPGSESMVRIDGGKPFTTRDRSGLFSGDASKLVIRALRAGTSAKTRHMVWPYKRWEDEELPLAGLAQAVDYACWAVKRLPK